MFSIIFFYGVREPTSLAKCTLEHAKLSHEEAPYANTKTAYPHILLDDHLRVSFGGHYDVSL